MDAVNLQFIFLNFPGIHANLGRLRWVAGLYREMLYEERLRWRENARRWQKAADMRRSILAEIEIRLLREESDDLVVVFAL